MNLAGWAPEAVVFDCDGLLMNTEPCWSVAETEVFARRGLDFGPQEKAMVIGRTIEAAGDLMAEAFGEPGRGPQIGAELLALVEVVVGDQAEAMAGSRELLALVAARRPVAVASNSPRALLDAALRRGGFGAGIAFTVAADEVPRAKPAPDMYLRACAELGAGPARSLALEDSMTGLRSAVAAGLRTVGVPSLPGVELPADFVVHHLNDPELITWVQGWPG